MTAKLEHFSSKDVDTLSDLILACVATQPSEHWCLNAYAIGGLIFNTGFNHNNRKAKDEFAWDLQHVWFKAEKKELQGVELTRAVRDVVNKAYNTANALAWQEKDRDHTRE